MHKQIQISVERGDGPKPRTKDVMWQQDIRVRLYTIGWLRYLTSLADVTLRGWERKEILPKPIMKLAGNTRWYSPAELVVYSTIIKQHYSSGRDLKVLKQRLSHAYVDIRKKYLGMKPGDTAIQGFDILPNEKKVEQVFSKQVTDKLLNKEHFYEIKQLIGDHQAPPNHKAVGGISVGGSKLRSRDTLSKQSHRPEKGEGKSRANR